MTDYTNIVNDLLSINDTMFAISTSNINIDKISIRMAFDKNWHNIAERAAAAIEELQQIADHYEQTAKEYWKEACEYKAQLPKRGEIVRCGECQHHEDEEPGMVYCPKIVGAWVSENWYCADGEREVQE